jgi:hypothetical protein
MTKKNLWKKSIEQIELSANNSSTKSFNALKSFLDD